MIQSTIKTITLKEFLQLAETKPASEYIEGKIRQKPMPKARHSRLQSKIVETINKAAEINKIAYAFPELRCTFGNRSIVPDIAVIRWQNIQFNEDGEPVDDILIAPDWAIEILSPNQSANQVTGKILHCLNYDCKLGWLIDPSDRSILVFERQKQPQLFRSQDNLKMIDGIELKLTTEQIFNWLKMNL